MISFIVIGKNEGWKLAKCFDSILSFVSTNNLVDSEIIYVDSRSTDNSIKTALSYSIVKTFTITGECNAAVARNIGGIESKGDVLYFIDGDMEIDTQFYSSAFDATTGHLKYDFVTGHLYEKRYNQEWTLTWEGMRKNYLNSDSFIDVTGGIFIIKKSIWQSVEGMKTKYKRSQDHDLCLRLSELNVRVLQIAKIIATHHTIPHNDEKRKWKLLTDGSLLYSSVLLRDHFLNRNFFKYYVLQNYTLLALLTFGLAAVYFNCYLLLGAYLAIAVFKTLRTYQNYGLNIIINLAHLFLRDVVRIGAIFAFWPSNHALVYSREL
jgi:glycosyltransferase involved in cell wall biosynthesis